MHSAKYRSRYFNVVIGNDTQPINAVVKPEADCLWVKSNRQTIFDRRNSPQNPVDIVS